MSVKGIVELLRNQHDISNTTIILNKFTRKTNNCLEKHWNMEQSSLNSPPLFISSHAINLYSSMP